MTDSTAIQVSQIDANAVRATLAIRVVIEEEPASANRRYRGEVYGPLANDRTTLPASYRMPDLRPGGEVQVVVTDPCFWSLESPLEYEITLTPIGDGGVLKTTIRLRTRGELP